VLGFVLGLDNARVALTLGAAGVGWPAAIRFSSAFAAFETVMPLVGAALGQSLSGRVEPWAEALGAISLALVGVYVLVVGIRSDRGEIGEERAWMVLGLPLTLSVDNLVAGIGLGLLGFPVVVSAVALGAISGAMCLLGFRLGGLISRVVARPAQIAAGIALVGLAVAAFV
jgi:putative Mn2+ efflux pump MntP